MTSPFQNRRRFGRRQVCKPAAITLQDGARLSVLIVDISEGGARIQTPHLDRIEGDLTLEIGEDDLVCECRVVHKQSTSIGVEFTRAPRRLSWLRSKAARRQRR